MTLLKLAKESLFNRKVTTILTLFSVALSVCLLLGIERVRNGARLSFESTVSGVDLIAGARSGPVNLMLYSVFRIGNATNNITYDSFEHISNHPKVKWTIPISLGDSHKGFRVVGTNLNYFKHYKYAGDRRLSFEKGREFKDLFEVVVGSEVARRLNYKISDNIILSHGADAVSFQDHDNTPFKVVGILKPTGTPVDNSVHTSLEAITAIHIDWESGAPPVHGHSHDADELEKMALKPADITSIFVKLNSRMAIFNVQREINDHPEEALMAILPGVTLRDLWTTIGSAQKVLFFVSIMVFLVSLIGMMISLLATLNERRREMAILRSIGAKKRFVFSLLVTETLVLTVGGMLIGGMLLYAGIFAFKPLLEPALRAYKNSLADGLTIKN
jgi:putative ABC transport system permease protein